MVLKITKSTFPALFLLSILLYTGCSSTNFKYFYPYTKVPPQKLKVLYPIQYEDCMSLLDTILADETINYFKNSEPTIAVLEISDQIGGYFINHWQLSRYLPGGPNTYASSKLPDTPINLPSRFTHDGVKNPHAMIRVVFSCYHKYLNHQPYSWQDEINKIKTYWIDPKKLEFSFDEPDTIRRLEKRVLSEYYFTLLNVNDTVDILYNRNPVLSSKNDWLYLTGIINFKLSEPYRINLRLIDISSESGRNFIPRENDTLNIGDTVTDNAHGWLKRGREYFNYNRNTEYRTGIQK